MINVTNHSLSYVKHISNNIDNKTFHHHYHILYDLPLYRKNSVYVEIGCYAGASACLMLQKDNIQVVSIDLGTPIHEDTVIENVKKLNVKNNPFTYLKGNSQSKDMVGRLQNIVSDIDILFIDGDHSKEGVMNDFLLYHEMVIPGGYIVFDDYNDHLYSPEVKPAVNIIVENFLNYEAIGTIKNELKARPETSIEGNCFIMRKIK